MVPLASLVDTAFLGHLPEDKNLTGLSGVAIATILFNYIYWTFGFLRMSTTGTTAIAAGKEDRDEVILTLLRNSSIALSVGTIIILLQQPLQAIGFAILSGSTAVKEAGIDYYNALIWGAPANLLNFVLLGWFLGREKGSKVLIISAIAKIANIILDYIFIVRLGWGSQGAGSATAISQYLAATVGIILIIREYPLPKLAPLWSKIADRSALLNSFNLNREILIRTLFLVSALSLFTNISSAFGGNFLAINSILMQIVSLAAYFIDGLAFATEAIAGKSRGSGTSELLLPLLKLAGATSLIIGSSIAIACIWQPATLFGILTDKTQTIVELTKYVNWLFPVLICGAIAYTLDGYFIGLTAGAILRNSTIIAAIVFFGPAAMVANYLHSNHILWLSLTLFMLGRAITLAIAVPRTLKSSQASN